MNDQTLRKKPNGTRAEAANGDSITVMIVDDHPLIRKGIATLIEAQPGMSVCHEAATVREALDWLAGQRPHVVVADLSLPETGDMELVAGIHHDHPDLPVLVLSMHDERIYAECALRAGARGYVMKTEPPERLIEGIRTVAHGGVFVSPNLASSMISTFVGAPTSTSRVGVARLSSRELEVFGGLGRGLSTARVAETLGLSVKTIETYRSHIKRKLGLESGSQLLHAAIRWAEEDTRSRPCAAPRAQP